MGIPMLCYPGHVYNIHTIHTIIKVVSKVIPPFTVIVPSFSHHIMCFFFFICIDINIYAHVILYMYTVYTIRTYAHYRKDTFRSLPSMIFPFSLTISLFLSPSRSNERGIKRKRRVSDCAILESTRHPA